MMAVSGLLLAGLAAFAGRGRKPDPFARQSGDLLGGRGQLVAAGLVFTAYGWFVAAQDSGTWSVPIVLILLPWGLAGWLIYSSTRPTQESSSPGTDAQS